MTRDPNAKLLNSAALEAAFDLEVAAHVAATVAKVAALRTHPHPHKDQPHMTKPVRPVVQSIDADFVKFLLDAAVSNGRLTVPDRISFETLIQRPRHLALLRNWVTATEAVEGAETSYPVEAYATFCRDVLDTLAPWMVAETKERQERERHLRVIARQHEEDAEARASGKPTKADRDTAAAAKAEVERERLRKSSRRGNLVDRA